MDTEQINPKQNRGKLKIFFGYAAGVGKTYAMLKAAHKASKLGVDVVVGYIEPHTRPETMALLDGLEQISNLELEYKNILLKDFDLDQAITRQPELILVDELAHTNVQGMRHKKRFQDIEELLRSGIDVYTTINVQHLESLNDIVASITGVVVRERIPDDLFDKADQVEIVDIEPDDLIERLNRGKIYRETQVDQALNNFFLKENLIALREIALRRSADRVSHLVEKNKLLTNNTDYFTEEHILICLSSSPSNAKVIRAATRLARAFNGSFTALYVDEQSDDGKDKERLLANVKLAEQSGARIVTMYGDDVATQISEFAKAAGVSKVVIGRSNNKKRLFFNKQSLVEKLTVLAPNLDVYIIPDYNLPPQKRKVKWLKQLHFSLIDFWKTVAVLFVATLIGAWFFELGFSDANIITVYILSTVIIAMITTGRIYSVASSIASVLVFNYFFTYPHFTLQAYDKGYPVTFLVMFIASFLISTLTTRVKEQARQSARLAHRTSVLLETSQKLQKMITYDQILDQTAKQVIKLLNCPVTIYPSKAGKLKEPKLYQTDDNKVLDKDYLSVDEQAVAQWVFKNNKHAGASTNTLPGAKCLYLAVRSQEQAFAVIGIAIGTKESISALEKNLLVALLGECALALEKEAAMETKSQIEIHAKQEQLRANLLRSISHDLRSPLTSISGNAGILLNNSTILDDVKKQELYSDIYDDSMWLINLVENLLAVTRIDNGTLAIELVPELVEEVCQEALSHVNRKSREHAITLHVENELLMAKMDSRLIIQVIINIVDNAIKYTHIGSHIKVDVKKIKGMIEIEIGDDGKGIKDEDKIKLFEMFYTANSISGDSRRGLGLGLALCKSIIEAHGGTIGVKDNFPQGTIFYFTLPAQEVNIYE